MPNIIIVFSYRVLCSAFVLLTAFVATAAQADTDCSVRDAAHDDPTWSCLPASNWSGGCVPSSAFNSWHCLELDADAMLCNDGGTFNMTVYLAHDNVSLDCNGQVIDHHYQDGDSKRPGIRTPYSYSVQNIGVKGCTIQNTGRYGIDLKRFFRGDELNGPMTGHHTIEVSEVAIHSPQQWGIYVGQNSRGVVLSAVTIDGAYGGVYLEAGSSGTRISDTTVVNSTTREAIAIDSSDKNIIESSFFSGNPDGINLYKNCGETSGQVCPIHRTTGANENLVRDCTFGGNSVNVAWRQFKLYGLGFCEDIDLLGYWHDHAEDNVFDGNDFDYSNLDVNDGPIIVHKNSFAHGSMLELGISEPLLWSGNSVNVSGTIASNTFGNAAGITYEGIVSVEEFENRNFSGDCEPYNACDFGITTLLGSTVTSMGIWAVLL